MMTAIETRSCRLGMELCTKRLVLVLVPVPVPVPINEPKLQCRFRNQNSNPALMLLSFAAAVVQVPQMTPRSVCGGCVKLSIWKDSADICCSWLVHNHGISKGLDLDPDLVLTMLPVMLPMTMTMTMTMTLTMFVISVCCFHPGCQPKRRAGDGMTQRIYRLDSDSQLWA